MANKITKFQKYEMLKAIPEVAKNEMLMEFIEHEQELLVKKNSGGGSGKSKAEKALDEANKERVYAALCDSTDPMTVTDIIRSHEDFKDFSTQKMSPILGWLIADGKVEKSVVKGRNYFSAIR